MANGMSFAMAAAIGLREDFDAKALRALAKRAKDGSQARRLLALAAIYSGATRGEAAKIGGVTLQIVRDWVLRFNALGPEGLVDRKAPGQPSRQWLFETFRICISETTVSLELRKMGYRKLSARPRHHAQREGAIEDFEKVSGGAWRRSPAKKASRRAT
jgi:hypothetical protein